MPNQPTPHTFYSDPQIGLTVTAHPGPGYWVVNFVRRRKMHKMLDQCAAWLPCGRWDDTRWHPVGARLVPPAALATVEAWLAERTLVQEADPINPSTPPIRAALERLVELNEQRAIASQWISAFAAARAALADPVGECPGCEGAPAASNSPCAVCGRPAAPPAPAPEVVEMVRRLHEINRPAAPPAPEPGEQHVSQPYKLPEVGEGDWDAEGLVYWLWSMRDLAGECNPEEQRRYAMTAALLEQLSAPAPVVPVPVLVGERLPGEGDCDAEGTCWVWNVTAYTWGLFRLDLTAHSHWLPAHAIPLPQAGEGEA